MKIRIKSRKPLLRFISVGAALLLWFYVLNAARVRVDKTVTIQYVLPDSSVFSVRPPAELTLTLEGPRAFMRQVETRDEKILIDLTRPQWRNQMRPRVTLRGDELALPFGVRVEKMLPATLDLRLERKASKVVPVRTPLIGELPDELQIQDLKIRPLEAEVVGSRSVIANLKGITHRPVVVDALLGQETLPLEWQLPDERMVVTSPGLPQMSYRLVARRANLVLEKVPVRFVGEGSIVSPKQVTVVMWAPADIARRTDKSDLNIQVWAEIPEGLKGKTKVNLRAVLPPRLHLVELRPQTILVEGP